MTCSVIPHVRRGEHAKTFEVQVQSPVLPLTDPPTYALKDMTDTTNHVFAFRDPSNAWSTVVGALTSGGSDGLVRCTTPTSDTFFEPEGVWAYQLLYEESGKRKATELLPLIVDPSYVA